MSIILKSIPLLEYYAENFAVSDFYFGFKKRLIANDFSGKLECFYEEALFYEKIRHRKKIKNDIKFYILHKSSREKLTQLIISAVDALEIINKAEDGIKKINSKKISFTEGHYRLINYVETYVFKLISFLDVLSKTNSYVYRLNGLSNVPETYGRQKYINGKTGNFQNKFDTAYQNRLLKNKAINIFHKYRNRFSHEKSIIVIPYFRKNDCRLIFGLGDKEGIKIREAIELSLRELKRFIGFSENYLIKKFK